MKIEEILLLGKMGYTKDEINAMISAAPAAPAAAPAAPAAAPAAPAAAPAAPAAAPTAPAIVGNSVESVETGEFDKLANMLVEIRNAIQTSNINSPAYGEMRPRKAEDILATIVNPDFGKEI